jgi:hypothetical protein
MSSADCFKYDFPSESSPDLSNIFSNNSKTINPILPFGLNIKGGVNICVTKCGHTLNHCEDIKIDNMINYGKMLVMIPNKKNSELILHFDARNENANQDGNGVYKLKYICFTCPPTIKIGTNDCDMQSYLIYSNDNGLYCILCTLYRNAMPYDNLANSLLSGLLNNNIPTRGTGGSSSLPINLGDFFPQDKQDYYQYYNTEASSNQIKNNILVKVYAKKVNISSVAINNLKNKLYKTNATCTFDNFNSGLQAIYSLKPQNLNITYVPDIGLSKLCKNKEKMEDYKNEDKNETEEDDELEIEEETSIIDKLTKSQLEEKKENYVNFTNDLIVYQIDLNTGTKDKLKGSDDQTNFGLTWQNLFLQYPDYDQEKIKEAINQFPYKTYNGKYWRIDYKIRLYKDTGNNKFEITDNIASIDDAALIIFDNIKKTEDVTDSERTQIFSSMRYFPDRGVVNENDENYYVTYYYETDETESVFLKFIFLSYCVTIILFNYIFYRIIFNFTNANETDISIEDNEIRDNENIKQLASWRFIINFSLFIQIVASIFYALLKVTNIYSNNFIYNIVFIILSIIFLTSTIAYAYLRLYYNDPKITYAENKSLTILLESEDENKHVTNKYLEYFSNASNLLKYLFYKEKSNLTLEDIYEQLTSLKNEVDSSTNINKETINSYDNKIEKIINRLPEDFKENIGKNNALTAPYMQYIINPVINLFNTLKTKIKDSTMNEPLKLNSEKLIKELEEKLGKANHSNQNNNNKSKSKNKNKNSNLPLNASQGGGSNNNINIPYISALKHEKPNKNKDEEIIHKEGYMTGKKDFPDLNNNSNIFKNDSIKKSDWLNNLLNTFTLKNVGIYIIFLTAYNIFSYKILDIVKMFDVSKTSNYTNVSNWIGFFSSFIYNLVFIICIIIWGFWFFGVKNNLNNLYIIVPYVGWILTLIYAFNFKNNKSTENWTIVSWVFLSVFLAIQLYYIYDFYKENLNIVYWLISAFSIISILTPVLVVYFKGSSKQKELTFRIMLGLLPALIYLTKYLLNTFFNPDADYSAKLNHIDTPITIPNINVNNDKIPITIPDMNENKENKNSAGMPEIGKTGEPLAPGTYASSMTGGGGGSIINNETIDEVSVKDNQNKHINHIKNLTNIMNYYDKSGNKYNKIMLDKMRNEYIESL